jgi:choline dehydrogenase-like flavoprotein
LVSTLAAVDKSLKNTSTMSFDYIIIGCGTAGLILSVRLTENPLVTLCVLEAGSNCVSDPLILTPSLSNAMIDNPGYDWMFITAPQANAHGRTFAWPRGKVLGGTSAINGAMLWHPSKGDLDSWERLVNKGRNFKNSANHYRKFETFIPPSTEGGEYLNSEYVHPQLHGTEGPIRVSL